MTKSPQAFRSIGEVARLVEVAPHVLRYWETQFPALSPVKRADGRRYYRLDDVLLAAGICEALREDGLTIRGARRLISQDRGAGLRARGRVRLSDRLGLEAEADATVAPTPVTSDSPVEQTPAVTAPQPPTAGVVHVAGPVAAPPIARRKSSQPPAPDALPLFPDLPDAEAAAHGACADAAGRWLARLTATAAALRRHPSPLPPAARPLADALRAAARQLTDAET
ncbi:MerR family transcriptional regulator [Paracoccus sanguinis]|uniref:HTH merR-type domain-containing protein n=1 Tax=Paracoccus sanguinis TaxID=1545044 RepID=A0A099GMF3_9RHOB|nr:MerR family transcriptional regulator [Paracoccus sanguinis]KGJ15012.1 hypothetical protein IX54_03915 [Paracoccus sanguinis]KGJ23717.1 hypothetical protein IX56_00050 [Paracoccus sanguinis]